MRKGKIIFILIFLPVAIGLIITGFSGNSTKIRDERLAPNSNKIGIGMYGKNNKIIDNGSTLDAGEGAIQTKLSLSHFMNNERDYKLLVFNNFEQVSFEANGENRTNYNFKAKENTENDIAILNEIDDETKEVDYLIIKEPNLLIEEFDLHLVLSMQQILSLRYNIENKQPLFSDSLSPLTTTNEGPIDDVFISDSESELNSLTSAKSGQSVYLTVVIQLIKF